MRNRDHAPFEKGAVPLDQMEPDIREQAEHILDAARSMFRENGQVFYCPYHSFVYFVSISAFAAMDQQLEVARAKFIELGSDGFKQWIDEEIKSNGDQREDGQRH
jgi:hypothetical protein